MDSNRKTIIGVLAGHDSGTKSNKLVRILNESFSKKVTRDRFLNHYHFVFTGGTFQRVVLGSDSIKANEGFDCVSPDIKKEILKISTHVPTYSDGGVTILSQLVVEHKCGILWSFLSPVFGHWLNPENLALMRLCDTMHVKRLMNYGSVKEWIEKESKTDINRNLQECPPCISFIQDNRSIKARKTDKGYEVPAIGEKGKVIPTLKKQTLALIAHDEMKPNMINFAMDYENELGQFNRILTTGTTGGKIIEATRTLRNKIVRCYSGPKGGDIEIATEILYGRCHSVIFFFDPSNPHPHIDDIRVVFSACMIRDNVRMFTNENHAREWIERVVRPMIK
ncbi:MAG: methylglyoxal synthase [Chlorobiales bacterium]|nr:methylglyoxal synthase [Chlorobiales bacterium]